MKICKKQFEKVIREEVQKALLPEEQINEFLGFGSKAKIDQALEKDDAERADELVKKNNELVDFVKDIEKDLLDLANSLGANLSENLKINEQDGEFFKTKTTGGGASKPESEQLAGLNRAKSQRESGKKDSSRKDVEDFAKGLMDTFNDPSFTTTGGEGLDYSSINSKEVKELIEGGKTTPNIEKIYNKRRFDLNSGAKVKEFDSFLEEVKGEYAKLQVGELQSALKEVASEKSELSGEINELQEQLALAKRELTTTTYQRDWGRIESQKYMEKVKEEKNNFMAEISQMKKKLDMSDMTIDALRVELDSYKSLTQGFLSKIQEMKEENEGLVKDVRGFGEKIGKNKEQMRDKIKDILSKFRELYNKIKLPDVPISNPKEYADDRKNKASVNTQTPAQVIPMGTNFEESKKLNKNNLKKIILEELKRIK